MTQLTPRQLRACRGVSATLCDVGLRSALRLVTDAPDLDAAAPATQPAWGYPASSVWTSASGVSVSLDEDAALQVPAFAQGVQTIAGTVGTFPLTQHRGRDGIPTDAFLTQPDPDEAGTVTWTRVCRDLVLHPYAWLYVWDRYASGFPRRAWHVPAQHVTINADRRVIYSGPDAGRLSAGMDITGGAVRFDSPAAPGALSTGARTLHSAILLEDAARRLATVDVPAGYVRQMGGLDLLPAEIDSLLQTWDAARAKRGTAYLGNGLEYATVGLNSRELQLVEARAAVAVDLARVLNLPPVYVNAETGGSLTYSTTESQAKGLANQTLAPYLFAIGGRLSMDDVTAQGNTVAHNLDAFLRSDLTSRAAAYSSLIASGVLTVDEARTAEGLPPLTGGTP